ARRAGHRHSLVDVLAPDMVLVTDGGGVKRAARRSGEGADEVLRFLVGVYDAASTPDVVLVGGAPALRLELDGQLEAVATFTVADGRITHLYIVRNPHKLGGLATPTALSR